MAARKTAPTVKVAKADITAEHLKALVHYDPLTGIFTRVKRTCNRVKVGAACGSLNTKGYLQISIENSLYLAANLAVLYMTGAWPKGVVDHRNTIKTDNRWDNLRDVTQEVNAQNVRTPRSNNKSGFLGVSPAGDKWVATIGLNKKKVYLGRFATPELASAAYLTAKREMHPGNTL